MSISKPSGKKKPTKGPSVTELEWNIKIKEKEQILMGYLSPIESSVMTFQNVLVWENPQHSGVLFVIVHILFWLATTVRVYYVIGLTGTIIVAVDMWKNHIWPEIRVPQSSREDLEEWTPVHPRLLSVPEICHWLAQWTLYFTDILHQAILMRSTNRPKFFICTMMIFSCTAMMGYYIPGILIAYTAVLLCLLWPCLLYHDGWRHIQEFLQPVLVQFENKLNIRRQRKGATKTGKHRHGEIPSHNANDNSDSDDDIDEFVPPPQDPQIQKILAVDDSESDEDGFTPGLLTPPYVPSQEGSRDHSDVEDSMGQSIDELGSLVTGLKRIPAHDDIDGSDTDERNDLVESDQLEKEVDAAITEDTYIEAPRGDQDAIHFVSSHFSQLSEEEESDNDKPRGSVESEKAIIQELSENMAAMPDAEDVAADITPTQAMVASGIQILTNQGQVLMSHGQSLVSAIGATGVSGIMATTVAGLHTIRETVSTIVHATQLNDDGVLNDSVDNKQLEAEFEFLNEEDLAEVGLDDDQLTQ